MSSLLLHHGWYDLSLLYWYALLIIPFLLSHHLHLVSHNFFLTIYSLFHHILTSIHLPDSTHFFTPFTWLVDGLNTSPPFTFHHWYSHQLFLSSHAHEIFLCIVHYTRGYEFDHWVFEPSFLSFLCPLTLAYVTSRVLKPPWGHEIRRYLWQSSLGQVFVDWLKYSRYYAFSYGGYFWKHLVSLLLGILIFDGFLSLEIVHWWYWIHPLVVHQTSTLGHVSLFLWGS